MELSAPVCDHIKQTADAFCGAERRRYIARTVAELGLSQRQAQRFFGWGRDTFCRQ